MESTRSKRRGFSKAKLVRSFYRAATKPSSAAVHQPYSTTKPPKPSPSPASLDFVANQPKPPPPPSSAFIIVNQDQVFPQQTPKVAFVAVADKKRDSNYAKLENFYGGAAEDEAVDAKAASYISSVRERFRLERVNSERKNFEDIHV